MNCLTLTKKPVRMMGLLCCLMGMTEFSNGQVFYVPDEQDLPDLITPQEGGPLGDEKKYDYGKAPYFDQLIPDYDYTKDFAISNEKVKEQIEWRLRLSPFVDGKTINVQVEGDTAVLSGDVETRSAMVDAVKIAYDAGARNVRNYLRIREEDEDPPWRQMTDRELKEAVEKELFWSPFVNSDLIRVQVQNGVVTLSGRSENQREMANAVKNAYEAGAKQVQNDLWFDPSIN